MESGQTQGAQPPAASTRWLQFAEWLRQQAGGPPDEAVSEASASDAEDASLPPEPSSSVSSSCPGGTTSTHGSSSNLASMARAGAGGPTAPTPVSPGQLARHATMAPRLPDCRAEMRLTSDSSMRARQEMTVMLAAPGMPLHEAPLLTAKQASTLMAAICEPLLSLPVGRLTRKLSAPTKLQPTEDRGMLSLWLLPDDSLSLVWQSSQQLPTPQMGTASSSSTSGMGAALVRSGSSAQHPPALQQTCSVAVWEELAHFPAMAHLLDDSPVVTIHMLRGDASGRSFYIRVRSDVAEANLEAATAAVPDASRLLAQQQQHRGSRAGAAAAALEADAADAPRMYFWLSDSDLTRAVYSLGRLKSLLKRPPTLAKRSGVPERQLAQLAAWVQRADLAAAHQQQEAEAAAIAALEAAVGDGELPPEWAELQASCGGPYGAAPAGAAAAPGPAAGTRSRPMGLSPLLQAPGLLLGQGMAAAAQVQGGMAAALMPPPPASDPNLATASGSANGGAAEGEAEGGACGSSTVSATAAALYQDQRFNVVCPCTVSVVVSMRVQAAAGASVDPALLPVEASARARSVAERQAKSAVDRSGRQRIEERLAEVVIRSIRAQRNRARKDRQAAHDTAARRALECQARDRARQATGRSAPAAEVSADTGSGPEEAEAEGYAAVPGTPAGAAAALDLDERRASPFAVAASTSSTGEAEACGTRSTPAAFDTPPHSSREDRDQDFASPSGVPVAAPLLPGGRVKRVTLDNLHSLLNSELNGPDLEAGSSQSSSTSELGGSAGAAAAGTEGRGSVAPASSGSLNVTDLAELLGKHAKLE